MRKLNPEQMQFIDSYLKNSGVEYLDIRFEMADHVASALERQDGDFYENFKAYMLEHKDALMAGNRQFRKAARKRAFDIIIKNILKPFFIIAVAVLFSVGFLLRNKYNYETVKDAYMVFNITVSFVLAAFVIYIRVFSKHTYSVTDQFFFIWLVAGIIFKPEYFIKSTLFTAAWYSLSTVVMVVVTVAFYKVYRHYNNQFGNSYEKA